MCGPAWRGLRRGGCRRSPTRSSKTRVRHVHGKQRAFGPAFYPLPAALCLLLPAPAPAVTCRPLLSTPPFPCPPAAAAMGATPPPNLDAYFGDLRVQAFLAAQQDGEPEGGLLSVLSSAQSALLARLAGPGVRQAPALPSSAAPSSSGVAGSSEKQLPGQLDVRGALPWLAGAAALAALALYGIRSSGGVLRLWPGSPVPPETAEAAAAIGLPLQALRPHHSAQWEQQQPAQGQREAGGEQQRQAAVISRDAARRLVQSWLVSPRERAGAGLLPASQ